MTPQAKRAAALILLGSWFLSTRVLAEDSIDWKHVPQSQLPARVAGMVCELEPVLSQKTSVLLPLPPSIAAAPAPNVAQPRRKARGNAESGGKNEIPPVVWNLEAYVSEVFTGLMSAAGLAFSDPEPCLELILAKNGKPKNLQAKLIQQVAKKANAGVVLVPRLLCRGTAVTLQVTAYDGENGKVLRLATCALKSRDLDYLANTPKTNRKTLQWVESRLGQKIDRGECWDLAAKGVEGGGTSWGPSDPFDFGRRLQPEETPFPGDPLANKNRSHTMLTYRFRGDGTIVILHQNWDYGKEDGRKVGWGTTAVKGNDFWRLRPASGERFADLMQAARAKLKEKEGQIKRINAE